ncbi:sensor of ECF-type sigma factor [Lutibacter sp.]|uniref:sensor of ECF-type sigma factor n=1 Tax=Lutibacter sp. TaxID=1925666 RepID=UPI0025B961C5|nr:sensor of ECF-type sigma factor [Lutibacter sp.]MCF6169136.1 sensor of ECF-type sigma factor [Lutibacter sp.]
MKKLLLLVYIILLTTNTTFSQQQNRQKIKALKTAHITEALNLTPTEAEKFWPIYNMYIIKIQALKRSLEGGIQHKVQLAGGIDFISNKEAQKLIDEAILIEQQITDNKIRLVKELSNIISAKKIIQLKKAERDFNRRILREFGKRRKLQRQ